MKTVSRLVIGTFAIISTLMFPQKIAAAAEFTTTFHSVYTLTNSDKTDVQHTITLKNNLSHIYATSYTIAVSGDQLTQITAFDEAGPVNISSSIQNGNTTIQMTISTPAIGKDQVKTLNLSYSTSDVVEIIGDTTTINIPRLSRANEAQEYTRVVRLPKSENRTEYLFPTPSKVESDNLYTIYTFLGHQNDSLSLLFGDSVTYRLNLIYELKNKELSPRESELALPSDTGYQQVLLNTITPPPKKIFVDQDGNWLARYALKAGEKITVQAELFVTVHPKPTFYDPSSTNFIKTSHSKYWDIDSAIVTSLAEQLKTPANIYEYLVSNFTYNYAGIAGGVGRLGALAALNSPTNVLCTEFTDVFVSLVRSRGIPSREINGYGYTKNKSQKPQNTNADILHSWAEYYDQDLSRWVSVDPTWGNTTGGVDYLQKLDFSHITFVRHGLEDSYPLPAGAYKSIPTDKHLSIEIATSIPDKVTTTTTKDNIVYNTGNVSVIHDQVGYLPPYGSAKIEPPKSTSFYDKIRDICVKLFSKFLPPQRVSM